MNNYLDVFEQLIIVIDVLVLLIMIWCFIINSKHLLCPDYLKKDVDFRFIMVMLCAVFIIANIKSLERHVDVFYILKEDSTEETMKSLLWDRSYMLASCIFKLLLTIKYKSDWYKN